MPEDTNELSDEDANELSDEASMPEYLPEPEDGILDMLASGRMTMPGFQFAQEDNAAFAALHTANRQHWL